MKAIILGINLHDYKSELNVGDLVVIDNGYDDFTILKKIDHCYGKQPGEENNPYAYFISMKPSGRLINYERCEISKAHVGFFDYNAYYKYGKKILLGNIDQNDLNYIKGKFACDDDIPFSEFDNIKLDDLIGLDFIGDINIKEYSCSYNTDIKTIKKTFKIKKPE